MPEDCNAGNIAEPNDYALVQVDHLVPVRGKAETYQKLGFIDKGDPWDDRNWWLLILKLNSPGNLACACPVHNGRKSNRWLDEVPVDWEICPRAEKIQKLAALFDDSRMSGEVNGGNRGDESYEDARRILEGPD